MARVFVDTNVLFPFSVMDLMLALSENAVHDVLWSDRLLDEWEHVIVRGHHRSPDAAAGITAAIRRYFADTQVPEDAYRDLVDEIEGPDPDDRHHMAAALAGGAQTLITWNKADFPEGYLAQRGLAVLDPDTYLCSLLDEVQEEVVATIARIAAGKRRPPMTPMNVIDALAKAGVPRFAERVRPCFDDHED